MENKRIAIPKKVRFEVFKRDKFTCQYCGAKAPESVLHVDHIDPVFEGGTNEITNLITSCASCNLGKGKVRLDDHSAVSKKHQMMAELEERRQQIEMMLEWERTLLNEKDQDIDAIDEILETGASIRLTEKGRKTIRRHLEKYDFLEVVKATHTAVDRIYDSTDESSLEKVISYIGRVLYRRGIYLNHPNRGRIDECTRHTSSRFPHIEEFKIQNLLVEAYNSDLSDGFIVDCVLEAKTWTQLNGWLTYHAEHGEPEND